MRACLRPGGVVIINTYFDPNDEMVNDTIMATVAAAFPQVMELRSPFSAGLVSSACLLAADTPLDPKWPLIWPRAARCHPRITKP